MFDSEDAGGAGKRVVDYSDPAQLPHPPRPLVHHKDTGSYVAAGVVTGMLVVCGVAYASYATGGFILKQGISPMHMVAQANSSSAVNQAK